MFMLFNNLFDASVANQGVIKMNLFICAACMIVNILCVCVVAVSGILSLAFKNYQFILIAGVISAIVFVASWFVHVVCALAIRRRMVKSVAGLWKDEEMVSPAEVKDFIERVRSDTPSVNMVAHCYHIEPYRVPYTYEVTSGNYTVTRVAYHEYYLWKCSKTDRVPFKFNSWKNVPVVDGTTPRFLLDNTSDRFSINNSNGMEQRLLDQDFGVSSHEQLQPQVSGSSYGAKKDPPYYKLKIIQTLQTADPETTDSFNRTYQQCHSANVKDDVMIHVCPEIVTNTMPDYIGSKTFNVLVANKRPQFTTPFWYILCSLFMVTVPYIMYLNSKNTMQEVEVNILKKVSINSFINDNDVCGLQCATPKEKYDEEAYNTNILSGVWGSHNYLDKIEQSPVL
jgi:hypothetical protein